MSAEPPVLDISDLTIRTRTGPTPLVDAVSVRVAAGESVALVGESGSGKSLTSLAALRLLPDTLDVRGSVRLGGEPVLDMSPQRLREVRGSTAAVIFQEPMSSLNPVLTVRTQLYEALRGVPKAGRRAAALELLDQVGITDPVRRLAQYPHELSGGMCQRVMIAIALAGRPRLLVADEPTTALDVTIQAQVLELLRTLTRDLDMALLLVTHDLGIVAAHCDRVNVMYAGRILERGPVDTVFGDPQHPYTRALLAAIPDVDAPPRRLPSLPGTVPTLATMPGGCRFHPRCPLAAATCTDRVPPLEPRAGGESACWMIGAAA